MSSGCFRLKCSWPTRNAHGQVSSSNWCSRSCFAYASSFPCKAAGATEMISRILLCLLGFAWQSSHYDTCTYCTSLQVKCFDAAVCTRHIRDIGVYLHHLKQGHEVRTRSINDSIGRHGDLRSAGATCLPDYWVIACCIALCLSHGCHFNCRLFLLRLAWTSRPWSAFLTPT